MNQFAKVQVPLNMGAVVQERAGLVGFCLVGFGFFFFLSPKQTLEHFGFRLRLPSPSSPMQSLSGSLASSTTTLAFFLRKME